jgi:hypothetical protein
MLVQLQVPIVVVCIISICVATFAIVCRGWARVLTQKRWQADDYLMLVAYVHKPYFLYNDLVTDLHSSRHVGC